MKRSTPAPGGFQYHPDFLTVTEEHALLTAIGGLELHQFRFQGFTAKRRVASFGYHYSFENFRLTPGPPLPSFLVSVRNKAAALIGEPAEHLAEALITEYPAGAGIGWHKDVAPFAAIVGISLQGACVFKLRRGMPGQRDIFTVRVEPRSVYVMSAVAHGMGAPHSGHSRA